MRVLYLIAHPDDEDPFTVTYLARGLGVDVTILSITRGECGQNALGDQVGAALGFLRSHELLAAAREYGASDLRFTSATDYGYSRRVAEAHARWNVDQLVAEVAAVIDEVRPALVLSRFSEHAEGEHAHHRVSGEIARRAATSVERVLFGLEEPARGQIPDAIAVAALRGYRCHRSQVPDQLLVGRDRPICYAGAGQRRELDDLVAGLSDRAPRPPRLAPPSSPVAPIDLALEPRVVHPPASLSIRARGPAGTSAELELEAGDLAIDPVQLRFDSAGVATATAAIGSGPPRLVRIEPRIAGAPVMRVQEMPPPCPPFVAPEAALAFTHPVEVRPRGPVGYIAGTGDGIPSALQVLGVDLADPADCTTLIVGLRAHHTRRDLPRFDDFCRRGGHLVLLGQTAPFDPSIHLPVPATMIEPAEEACEEDAPVRILAPEHPLLAAPNRITLADFDGWFEQRGSRFLSSWDPSYVPLVELADPGRAPQRGVFLSAPCGAGRVTYVALALHRQLPEAIPGAYRILANLISA
jgi:LmbE family N-acetylglucosaminyl deacetylase